MEFNLEFYKDLYYKEIERREQFSNKLNFPLAILTLVFGGLFYTIQNNDLIKIEWLHILFFILSCATFLLLLIHIVVLFRSSFGYKYAYVPSPELIKEHETSLKNYHMQYNKEAENIPELIEADLKTYLIETYVKMTKVNVGENDRKAGWFRIGSYFIIAYVTALLLTFICFAPSFINKEENIQKVIIQNHENSSDNPTFNIEIQNRQDLTDENGNIKIKLSDLNKILEEVEKGDSKQ